MDPERLQALLEAVRTERVPIAEALQQLRELPFRTLEFARVDTHRHLRTGYYLAERRWSSARFWQRRQRNP